MKKTATSVLALLLALGFAAPVMAQETTGDDTTAEDLGVDTGDTGVDADVGADTDVDADLGTDDTGADVGADVGTGTDTDMNADTGTDTATGMDAGTGDASADFMTRTGMSYDQLVTELQSQTDDTEVTTDLQNLSTDTEVIVVKLSDLRGGLAEGGTTLDETLADLQAGLPYFHGAINANATVRDAIEAEGMVAEDVVAVHRLDDGRMIVVVNDTI